MALSSKPVAVIAGKKIYALELNDLVKYFNDIWTGESYSFDSNHTSTTASAFTIGNEYTILLPGTTNFTLIGSADSAVGTTFTATGVGVGTGTATDNRRYGWGQTPATINPTVSTGSLITRLSFNQAIAQVNAGQYHTQDNPTLLHPKIADTHTDPISPENYNSVVNKISGIEDNKYKVDWAEWDKDQFVTASGNINWTDDLSIAHKFSFTDYNEARHFFNSGGELSLELEMAPGGPAAQDVWRQIFDRFDSIRIGAEKCRIVADDAFDVLSTSTIPVTGFYNGITYNEDYQTIFDAGVFRHTGANSEYAYSYVYVYSEYNSRRIRFQMKADETGGTFNIYVKVILVEDEDDTLGITQSISLYSGWSRPTQAPTASDGNESYMTTGAVVARFQQRAAPTITEAQAWTAENVEPGIQLDNVTNDWIGSTLLNVPAGHFEIGKEYKIASINYEISTARIETGTAYIIKTVGTTDFTKIGLPNNIITSSNFVLGTRYKIITAGTTDFVTEQGEAAFSETGTSSNVVGTIFTATSVGTGTGTATEIGAVGESFTATRTDDTTGTVTLSTATNTDFTLIGAANNTVGTVFTYNGVTGTGNGVADEVSLTNTDPGIEWHQYANKEYKALKGICTLSSDVASIDEGGTFTITLATTNFVAGTVIPYTITGVTSTDISESLTGNFVVGTTDTITFTVVEDITTDGAETFLMTLDGKGVTHSVTINDTSQSTYVLTSNASAVNEGDTFTVTLATTGIANGTTLPYTITGIVSADISGEPLTGNFVVGTTDVITFVVSSDVTTEGTETFVIALDNGGASSSVIISDTSQPAPTYLLSTSETSVNEGSTFTITLATTNLVAGEILPYTITGVTSTDISESLTGNFVVGTTDAITFTALADQLTDNTTSIETFTISLDNGEASQSVTINDTSQSVVTPLYSLNVSASPVNESDTFTVTLTTLNVAADTVIPYTITGVDSADIDGASLTGSFTNSVSGLEKTFTVSNDLSLNEGAETFVLTIDGTTSNNSVLIADSSIIIYELRDIFADAYKNFTPATPITTATIDARINAINDIRLAAVAESVSAANYKTMVTAFMEDNISLFTTTYNNLTTPQKTAIVAGIMPLVNNDFENMNTTSNNTNYGSAYPTNYTADTAGFNNYLQFYVANITAMDADIAAFSASLHNLNDANIVLLNYTDDILDPIAPTTPVPSSVWYPN